jgi:hypothetical protein
VAPAAGFRCLTKGLKPHEKEWIFIADSAVQMQENEDGKRVIFRFNINDLQHQSDARKCNRQKLDAAAQNRAP